MKKNKLSYLLLGVGVGAFFLTRELFFERSAQMSENTEKTVAKIESRNALVKPGAGHVDSQSTSSKDQHIKDSVDFLDTQVDTSDTPQIKFSKKLQHINKLRKANVIETIELASSLTVEKPSRFTLVESNDGQWKRYIIQDILNEKNGEILTSYVIVAGQVLVKFKGASNTDSVKSLSQKYGLKLKENLLLRDAYLFTFDNDSLSHTQHLVQALSEDSQIEYFSYNSLNYSTLVPNDTHYDKLWGLSNDGQDNANTNQAFQADLDVQADAAWDDITDCTAAPVAVLDTGIDPNHPDLKDNVDTTQSRDFTTNNAQDFIDRQSHGTHVSGTIGAVGNNNMGIAGVCWKAKLIGIKVLNDQGAGTSAMLINGLMHAATTDAKVLNLSLGGGAPSQVEMDAINANVQAGKLLVMAAGNENNDNDANPSYPASYDIDEIISVAAITPAGTMAAFSNFGATTVDIAAPGQSILSTVPIDSARNNPDLFGPYDLLDGTSMASPHVAGAVALFWAYAPEMSAAQVKTAILDSGAQASFNNKSILTSKILDLEQLVSQVQASIDFTDLPGQVSLENQAQFTLTLAVEKRLADIEKIEIFHDEVLLGEADIDGGEVTIKLPIGVKEAQLTAKITDTQGRTYSTDVVNVALDISKVVTFAETKNISQGSIDCTLKLKGDGDQEKLLNQATVPSGAACRKFCDISGPMVYSSKGSVVCSSGSDIIYEVEAK